MHEPEHVYAPVIIAVTFFLLTMIFYFLTSFYPLWVKKNLAVLFLPLHLKHRYKEHLVANFPFYNKLSDADQLLFERRVQKFINMKEFIPRGGLREVTPEMKTLIAGSAIQLTFGHPSIYFRHFWRILVYPDSYYSTITQKYHHGEVNRAGIIVVSWQALREGFHCHADGRHLGFHEMAHALRLINLIDNKEYNIYDGRLMKDFDTEARREVSRMNNDPNLQTPFRMYGATSREEFFAVAVEVFFEQPGQFKNHNPVLYDTLRKMLKIDPGAANMSKGIRKLAS